MTPGGFPPSLAGLPDRPERIWVRGVLPPLEDGQAVAVVGARAASGRALELAREVAAGLVQRGMVVVSGGALGVDGAAHEAALAAGGHTVVVLGTGIDVIYPARHRRLFEDVAARGGAILTQFPPGDGAQPWHFPKRNRIIAALSTSCVVIEAGEASGALITAREARGLGRRVVACLGSTGCDALVARGEAEAASSAEEALVLACEPGAVRPAVVALPVRREVAEPSDPHAARLFRALDHTPRELGELAASAGLDVSTAMALAIDLELGGLARRLAGGRYQRMM